MRKKQNYKPNEVILVEVESRTRNLTVGKHQLPAGKSKLEILGAELDLFQSLVEPEPDALEEAQQRQQEQIAKIRERFQGEEEYADREVGDFIFNGGSVPALFKRRTFRDPKPLASVKVLESKGIPPTPENTNEQVMRLLAEMLNKQGKAN